MSTIIDRIFSHPGLDQLDKAALARKYDVTGALSFLKEPIRSQTGQLPLASSSISAIPPEGIIIDSPGTYTVSNDLDWRPEPGHRTAITIMANDVVLDMAGFTLTATVQDNSQLIVGIRVGNMAQGGVSNVTVQNGTLAGLCFYGVCAENVDHLALENITVTGLVFDNLDQRLLCPAGIHVDKATDVTIAGCTVQFIYATADSSAGIQILNTTTATVSGCRMSDLVNYDGSVQGYSYILSSKIATSNCSSERFQSHFRNNIQTPGHTVLGFCPLFCVELTFDNCTATNMTGCCDDCHAMSVFLDAEVSVTNFTAHTVIDGMTHSHSGAKATGLEVYGALVSISGCTVEKIRAIHPQDRQAAGFSAWGAGISFTDCNAFDVSVTDEHGRADTALGYGTGFGWAPDPRPILGHVGAYGVIYDRCGASDCQVGFDTWNHVDSVWTDVRYTRCGIDILVEPNGTRTLSCNPCSECNPPITVTLTNMASGNTYPSS